ncbi:lanthionine synthetase LanC family protein, partial [Kitasatospora sp. NPDC059571]|uniref:lanthionine synthetase LanC family protein n=1 Tax=Kitasatospora sp. NPDC059571 TaxID=3346871 RepID=UPI00368E47FA
PPPPPPPAPPPPPPPPPRAAAPRPETLPAAPPAQVARGGWALHRFAAAAGRTDLAAPALTGLRAALALRVGAAPTGTPPGGAPLSGGALIGSALIGTALAVADSGAAAGDAEFAGFLAEAVAALSACGPLADHSLLHGEAGALELLLATAPDGAVAGPAAVRAGRLLADLDRFGPRCGTPDTIVTPGLLTGLAGIGHTLLRLAHPARIPSVLVLQPH